MSTSIVVTGFSGSPPFLSTGGRLLRRRLIIGSFPHSVTGCDVTPSWNLCLRITLFGPWFPVSSILRYLSCLGLRLVPTQSSTVPDPPTRLLLLTTTPRQSRTPLPATPHSRRPRVKEDPTTFGEPSAVFTTNVLLRLHDLQWLTVRNFTNFNL